MGANTTETDSVYDTLVKDLGEPGVGRSMLNEGHTSVQGGSGHYYGGGDSMLFTGNPMVIYKPSVVGFHAEDGRVTGYLVHNVRAFEGDGFTADSIVAQGPNRQQFDTRAEFLGFCESLDVTLEEPVPLSGFLEARQDQS